MARGSGLGRGGSSPSDSLFHTANQELDWKGGGWVRGSGGQAPQPAQVGLTVHLLLLHLEG